MDDLDELFSVGGAGGNKTLWRAWRKKSPPCL